MFETENLRGLLEPAILEERRFRRLNEYAPSRIIDLAEQEPIVLECFRAWQNGNLSWDETLIAMVLHLAHWKKEVTPYLPKTAPTPSTESSSQASIDAGGKST
jgi:hypothetical protein